MKTFDEEQIYFYGRKIQRDFSDNVYKTCSCCILLKPCISRRYKKKRHKYINYTDQLSHYKEIWQL